MIPGKLPGLNDAINAARKGIRGGWNAEADLRKKYEQQITWFINRSLRGWKASSPVILHYKFYEPDRRRDKDNICGYALKLVHDSLVKSGHLPDDNWTWVRNFDFEWAVDKKNPRIEVEIEERTET